MFTQPSISSISVRFISEYTRLGLQPTSGGISTWQSSFGFIPLSCHGSSQRIPGIVLGKVAEHCLWEFPLSLPPISWGHFRFVVAPCGLFHLPTCKPPSTESWSMLIPVIFHMLFVLRKHLLDNLFSANTTTAKGLVTDCCRTEAHLVLPCVSNPGTNSGNYRQGWKATEKK